MNEFKYILLPLIMFISEAGIAQTEPALCQGGRFKPCICASSVTTDVSYRPTFEGCNGNAAIITRGEFLDIFSVVVRDSENRDRWPRFGFNGCNRRLSTSAAPPNRCSAFKAQRVYVRENENGISERVSCLGAPGTSKLFSKVTRITAKLRDIPGSNKDPLVRWCLAGPTLPLN